MLFQMSFLSVIWVLTAVQGWCLFNDQGFLLLHWRKRPYLSWGREFQLEYIFIQSVSTATANVAAVVFFSTLLWFYFAKHHVCFCSLLAHSQIWKMWQIRSFNPRESTGICGYNKKRNVLLQGLMYDRFYVSGSVSMGEKYAEIDKSRQGLPHCWLLRSILEIILKY